MPELRLAALTLLAMVAFASNSLLCRVALKDTSIDAVTFTTIRLVSGAAMLALIAFALKRSSSGRGTWSSALALFVYAIGFSFAYESLTAATGALILFGAVQATMIGYGIWTGERFGGTQAIGLVLAIAGFVGLMLPGLSAPPFVGALLMTAAGIAWGVYSLRGKGAGDPTLVTAGNFLRSVPITLLFSFVCMPTAQWDPTGVWCAIISGAITSGLGYAVWYTALPGLKATSAATIQLSVPILAAIGGILFLGETLTVRLMIAALAILGGIALVIRSKEKQEPKRVAESR